MIALQCPQMLDLHLPCLLVMRQLFAHLLAVSRDGAGWSSMQMLHGL